ncbi:MAG: hypothetical protein ACE5GM_08640 [bacterium]
MSRLSKIAFKALLIFALAGLVFHGSLRAQEPEDLEELPEMGQHVRKIIFGSANRKISNVQYEIAGKKIIVTAKFHNSEKFKNQTIPDQEIEWYARALKYDYHFQLSSYKVKYFKGNDADLRFEFPFEDRNEIGQVTVTCGRRHRDFSPVPKPTKRSDNIHAAGTTTSISDVRYVRKDGKIIVKARFTFREQPRFLTIPLEEIKRYARANVYDEKHQLVATKEVFFKGLTRDVEFEFKDFDRLRDIIVASGIVDRDTPPVPKPIEKPKVIKVESSSRDIWGISSKKEGGNIIVYGKFRSELVKDDKRNVKNKPWYFYANEKKKAETDKKLYYVRATGHDLHHKLVSVNEISLTDYEKRFEMTVKNIPDLAYIRLSSGTLRRLFSRYK